MIGRLSRWNQTSRWDQTLSGHAHYIQLYGKSIDLYLETNSLCARDQGILNFSYN